MIIQINGITYETVEIISRESLELTHPNVFQQMMKMKRDMTAMIKRPRGTRHYWTHHYESLQGHELRNNGWSNPY